MATDTLGFQQVLKKERADLVPIGTVQTKRIVEDETSDEVWLGVGLLAYVCEVE